MNKHRPRPQIDNKQPLEVAQVLLGALFILGACAFWFLMLWFGTKE